MALLKGEYLVEKIMDERGEGENGEYFVKWIGYSVSFKTTIFI